jgi:hypothetical protein
LYTILPALALCENGASRLNERPDKQLSVAVATRFKENQSWIVGHIASCSACTARPAR